MTLHRNSYLKSINLFSVLASDGLWDTHTNEEAVSVIKYRLGKDRLMGAETLAREAFSRGSLDNITVLVLDLRRFKEYNI